MIVQYTWTRLDCRIRVKLYGAWYLSKIATDIFVKIQYTRLVKQTKIFDWSHDAWKMWLWKFNFSNPIYRVVTWTVTAKLFSCECHWASQTQRSFGKMIELAKLRLAIYKVLYASITLGMPPRYNYTYIIIHRQGVDWNIHKITLDSDGI